MDLNRTNLCSLAVQVSKFGVVGLCATFVHVAVFMMTVEAELATPMVANIIAFIPAFMLSFYSHFVWTFQCEQRDRPYVIRTMAKFLVVALLGVGLNSYGVYLVTEVLKIDYYFSVLFFVFVTPAVLFVLNKLLVFK